MKIFFLYCILMACISSSSNYKYADRIIKIKNIKPEIKEIKETEYLGLKAENTKINDFSDETFDTSNIQDGILKTNFDSDKRAILQIEKDDKEYHFEIKHNGETNFIPLTRGNGLYSVKLMENYNENKFLKKKEINIYVNSESSKDVFLKENIAIPYYNNNEVQALYKYLKDISGDDEEYINNTIKYFQKYFKYDGGKEYARQDYLSDLVLTGKGQCRDFAGLFAALMRLNNIPTKMVFGYLNQGDNPVYHAWNEVYINNKWEKIDMTVLVIDKTGPWFNEKLYKEDIYW